MGRIADYIEGDLHLPFQAGDGIPAALQHRENLRIPGLKAAVNLRQLVQIILAKPASDKPHHPKQGVFLLRYHFRNPQRFPRVCLKLQIRKLFSY